MEQYFFSWKVVQDLIFNGLNKRGTAAKIGIIFLIDLVVGRPLSLQQTPQSLNLHVFQNFSMSQLSLKCFDFVTSYLSSVFKTVLQYL